MFQGMLRSQFLHVSGQFVASKAVRAGHHKLIASHSLKPPEMSQDCDPIEIKIIRQTIVWLKALKFVCFT